MMTSDYDKLLFAYPAIKNFSGSYINPGSKEYYESEYCDLELCYDTNEANESISDRVKNVYRRLYKDVPEGVLIKDNSSQPGDSSDLAFLLTLLSNFYIPSIEPCKILCTGLLVKNYLQPFKTAENQRLFLCKLDSFIKQNEYKIFICPKENILPSWRSYFKNKTNNIDYYESSELHKIRKFSSNKIVISVGESSGDLILLSKLLFHGVRRNYKQLYKYLFVAFTILIFFATCYFVKKQIDDKEKIHTQLKYGLEKYSNFLDKYENIINKHYNSELNSGRKMSGTIIDIDLKPPESEEHSIILDEEDTGSLCRDVQNITYSLKGVISLKDYIALEDSCVYLCTSDRVGLGNWFDLNANRKLYFKDKKYYKYSEIK
ncbi:MAG TPA: hypothetical protein PLI06_10120, partial [Methanofastidiosum sp.]|nr:hypothetical protein [Methanofastidiosum sp.]